MRVSRDGKASWRKLKMFFVLLFCKFETEPIKNFRLMFSTVVDGVVSKVC
jgi:hypothetical protein